MELNLFEEHSDNYRSIWVRKHATDDQYTSIKDKNVFSNSAERKLISGNSVQSMKKNFELFQIKKDQSSIVPSIKSESANPFNHVEKSEIDSKEKEDFGRKRKQRIEEFIHDHETRSPAAKKSRTGTVYDTIKNFALSDDKNADLVMRKAMTPSESYQLLQNWINARIQNYLAFVPVVTDLSVSTFNNGSVLAALAHSFNPFQLSFFQLVKKSREEKLKFSWETFRIVTGEQPIYSLEDALSASSQKLDRKCLLAMLFLIREKVILQNYRNSSRNH